MTNSSVQPVSYNWSSDSTGAGFIAQDVITLDPSVMANINVAAGGIGNVTISNTTGSNYYYTGNGSSGTISVGAIGSGATVTLSGVGIGYEWQMPVEWKDRFPDWAKVEKMCEEYPGLKIAFEKFKTTYKLVVDHYDTPEDKRPKP
jgi:lipoprotein-anchoring transpeptidase ErfK/SrfK